ncbi:MAG TPA: hypothetical protein VKN82_07525 [Desulfohalobiaceae bacterium]|nr:hypothetical protein [Desulfohalobiaceae bacterium]
MLVTNRKAFSLGIILAIVFFLTLIYMFTPSFNGTNAFHASDALFNSRSKDNAYFIPKLQQDNRKYLNESFSVTLDLKLLEQAEKLLSVAGCQVERKEGQLKIFGNLGQTVKSSLVDAEALYYNQAEKVASRYGLPAKEVLYTWELIFNDLKEVLNEQKHFDQAQFINEVMYKGVEVAYNYCGIEASSNNGILVFALVFYVVYTLWWGFAIYFLFEGVGLIMTAGEKKEA